MEKTAEESLNELEKEISTCKMRLWPKLFGDYKVESMIKVKILMKCWTMRRKLKKK